MKITLFSLGSRGDVQPFLALAVGLQQAGHRATLVAPYKSVEWIQSYGVNAHPVRLDSQEFMQRPEVQAIMKSGNVLRQLRLMRGDMSKIMVEGLEDYWQAAQDADFVVGGGAGLGGVEVASQRGIPLAFAFLFPFAPPTRAFPSFVIPFRSSLGSGYNYLTHNLFLRAAWPAMGGPLNQWRATRFGLRPWRSFQQMYNSPRSSGTPWLYAYSPSVLPKPPDWESRHHVTGYWFLDEPSDWQPPADLLHFLESGSPPVYVGFGSMRDENPERQTRLALRALEITGQRGVLLTGWGGISRLETSSDVFFVENVPHSWLFPRVAVVVHHGGAGTTGAGLRAGVPSIVTPFTLDQHAWAEQVEKLGVGPRAGEIKKLTAEKLAEAINTAINDSALRARAAALGKEIRAENGIAVAVELIERHAAQSSRT